MWFLYDDANQKGVVSLSIYVCIYVIQTNKIDHKIKDQIPM